MLHQSDLLNTFLLVTSIVGAIVGTCYLASVIRRVNTRTSPILSVVYSASLTLLVVWVSVTTIPSLTSF